MEMHENKNVAEAKQADREREASKEQHEHARTSPEARPGGEVDKEAKTSGAAVVNPAARPAAGHGKAKTRKNNLKKLRLERMISKAELARRAGVSTLTIDRVERGISCRMDTKRKILEALGLKPSDRLAVFGEDE